MPTNKNEGFEALSAEDVRALMKLSEAGFTNVEMQELNNELGADAEPGSNLATAIMTNGEDIPQVWKNRFMNKLGHTVSKVPERALSWLWNKMKALKRAPSRPEMRTLIKEARARGDVGLGRI